MQNFEELEKQISKSKEDVDNILEAAGLTRCGNHWCDKEIIQGYSLTMLLLFGTAGLVTGIVFGLCIAFILSFGGAA